MPPETVTIIIAIVSALGGGGIGAAVVNWLANHKKVKADSYSVLSENYENRLNSLTNRANALEDRVERLEAIIDKLKLEVDKRDAIIDELKQENCDLKIEMKKLKADNECKDRKIAKLERQVKELTARIDAINSREKGKP